jgi:uncharacterized protein (DUF1778 family)
MMNRWIVRATLINRDVLDAAATIDGNELGQVNRQAVVERAERMVIDGHSKLVRIGRDGDLERLIRLNWTAAVALLMTPVLVLEVIANNRVLLWPNAQMQHRVIARLQRCTALNVDVTSAKSSMIVSHIARFVISRQQQITIET